MIAVDAPTVTPDDAGLPGFTVRIIPDFRAGVAFTPTKGEGFGPWECWRNCKGGDLPDGTIGLIPTGDWLCWNADDPNQMGFADPNMAEMFCVFLNGPGERTRIVDPFTGEKASVLVYDEIAPKIEAEMSR